ncbi:unnamed protein product [Paramecium pentaurelia]|uniref:Uncharacterized protein n=1 Tax=Paramecium pentaurelia TaxID=43138 RepID=A0A8S1UFA9_9CILI|nr:unnamed protein product [Paramecium pentaurelia]
MNIKNQRNNIIQVLFQKMQLDQLQLVMFKNFKVHILQNYNKNNRDLYKRNQFIGILKVEPLHMNQVRLIKMNYIILKEMNIIYVKIEDSSSQRNIFIQK